MFIAPFNRKDVALLILGLGISGLGISALGLSRACAQATITITIPRHSSLTLVQRLNREGVEEIEHHDYQKAAGFFYKAYLYDPADPFTLNNLGYISEMQGQLDQADKFYKLAAEQGSNAAIDLSNVKRLEGQPMQVAFAGVQDTPTRVDRINAEAMRLLARNRGAEAVGLLEQALVLDPHDPFTLNNLGVANETIGNSSAALKDYTEAAQSRSREAVIVYRNPSWQGKPLSEVAQSNAARLQTQLTGASSASAQSYELNLRGVIAENENDWSTARRDFLQAYTIDPENAFSLNNRGYVAERDGDLESAQFFYRKAWQASGSGLRVGLATNRSQQGQPLFQVADDSGRKVDGALEIYGQQRRGQTGPVELTPRGNGAAGSSTPASQPPNSPAAQPASPQPQAHP
jgi:Flp pilus assembly protein TadD